MSKKAAPAKNAETPKSPTKAVAPLTDPTPTAAVTETPVRKTVVPEASPAGATIEVSKAPTPLTYDRIAERAYHISQSGTGGSEYDNWLRAESELKSEA